MKKNTSLIPIAIVAFILVFMFSLLGVIREFVNSSFIIQIDNQIENFLYNLRTDILTSFFYFITLFAEPVTTFFASIAISIYIWLHKNRIFLFIFWFSMTFGLGLTYLGKLFFQKSRPDLAIRLVIENSYTFPSAHASVVVLLYGFITYLIFRTTRYFTVKLLTILSFVALVILVDLSRLYLGVHYLSDVIAGNIIALLVLVLSISIAEFFVKE